jgi:hypothetical protein
MGNTSNAIKSFWLLSPTQVLKLVLYYACARADCLVRLAVRESVFAPFVQNGV